MPLFLVSGYIDVHGYPDESSREENVMRIVIADDADAAEKKFIKALTVDDPFGTSRTPEVREVNEAIA